jgi:hypothetical protein
VARVHQPALVTHDFAADTCMGSRRSCCDSANFLK